MQNLVCRVWLLASCSWLCVSQFNVVHYDHWREAIVFLL